MRENDNGWMKLNDFHRYEIVLRQYEHNKKKYMQIIIIIVSKYRTKTHTLESTIFSSK